MKKMTLLLIVFLATMIWRKIGIVNYSNPDDEVVIYIALLASIASLRFIPRKSYN